MARQFTANRPFNVNGQNFATNTVWDADGPVPETMGLALCKLGFGGLTGGPGVPGEFLAMARQTGGPIADPDPPQPQPEPEPPGTGGEGEGGEVQPMSSTEGPTRRPSRR